VAPEVNQENKMIPLKQEKAVEILKNASPLDGDIRHLMQSLISDLYLFCRDVAYTGTEVISELYLVDKAVIRSANLESDVLWSKYIIGHAISGKSNETGESYGL
jgi:hypothetical protein